MVKKILTESLIEARFCDLCNKRIPKRNHRNAVTEWCIMCKKDCCFECQIQLRKKIGVGTYHYTTITYGVICKKCCKKLNTNNRGEWQFLAGLKSSVSLPRFYERFRSKDNQSTA